MSSESKPARIGQVFQCVECGAPSKVHVHPSDTDRNIGYVCSGDCDGVTEHEPGGLTNWFDTPGNE